MVYRPKTISQKVYQSSKPVALATLLIATSIASANEITWDNGGIGSSALKWSTAANWNPDGVPTASDDVVFGDTGTASTAIALSSASQTVNSIAINTTNTFSITGGTISTSTILRNATSGDQTIASAVSMGSAASISVNGTGTLTLSGGLTLTPTGYTFTKNGSGELILSGSTLTTGNTADASGNGIGEVFINEGKLTVRSNVAWKANHFTIGDGTHAATVVFNPTTATQSIQNRTVITVNSGSLLQLQNQNQGYYESLAINEGTVDLGGGTYIAYNVNDSTGTPVTPGTAAVPSITLNGGEIKNGAINLGYLATAAPIISTVASSKTSVISASLNQNGSISPIQVADGSAVIDLEVSGQLVGSTSFKKTGAGLMRLSYDGGANINTGKTTTSVMEGTLLIKNSSGSATGGGGVSVSAGATFGGTGIIKPMSYVDTQSKNVANTIKLSAGTAASYATLTVGDVDASTGQSLIGALTIDFSSDSYEQSNGKLIFEQYSRLALQLDNGGVSDTLNVIGGSIDLSAANDCLDLQSIGSDIAGTYTLLTFTGTLIGKFDVINGLNGYSLSYRDANGNIVDTSDSHYTSIAGGGSMILTAAPVPEPAALGLLAIGGMHILLSKKGKRK